MTARLWDISRLLADTTAVWPGDEPIQLIRTLRRTDGDPVDCGAVRLTLHAGTHLDAPTHVLPDTPTVDEIPLDACVGEAWVVDCGDASLLDLDLLTPRLPEAAERVLLRSTGSQRPDEHWDPVFPTLTPGAARALVERGVRLVGVDTPSVDTFDSPTLPVHEILLGAGVVILENLQLREVPAGLYELIALPLRLRGMDGSPVRAVLRQP